MKAKGVNDVKLGESNPGIALYTPLAKPKKRVSYVIEDYVDLVDSIYRRVDYKRELSTRPQGQAASVSEVCYPHHSEGS